MRKTLVLSLFLACSIAGFSQKGIGVRLGDPSGITFKTYNGDNALEFSIGRTHLVGKGFYNDHFFKWYSDAAFGYKDYNLISSDISTPIGMHVHYLIHQDWFASDLDGLQWYYGFGGQFRFQSFSHSYRYKLEGNSSWFYAETKKVTDIDFGGDGVLGAEYEFKDVPVRVFIDLTLFMEIVDDPFRFWFQAGIGGRYMF